MIDSAKLRAVMKARAVSVAELGRSMGITGQPVHLYRLLKGGHEAKRETVEKVADALGISPVEILDDKITHWFSDDKTDGGKQIFNDSNVSLPEVAKKLFSLMADVGMNIRDVIPREYLMPSIEGASSIAVKLPLVGRVSAGTPDVPAYTDGEYPAGSGFEEIDVSVPDPNAYAVRVVGDSMAPVFHDGDCLVITPNIQWQNRRAVLVRHADGRVWVKRVKELQETVMLESLNPSPEYETIVLQRSEVAYIHRVHMAIAR